MAKLRSGAAREPLPELGQRARWWVYRNLQVRLPQGIAIAMRVTQPFLLFLIGLTGFLFVYMPAARDLFIALLDAGGDDGGRFPLQQTAAVAVFILLTSMFLRAIYGVFSRVHSSALEINGAQLIDPGWARFLRRLIGSLVSAAPALWMGLGFLVASSDISRYKAALESELDLSGDAAAIRFEGRINIAEISDQAIYCAGACVVAGFFIALAEWLLDGWSRVNQRAAIVVAARYACYAGLIAAIAAPFFLRPGEMLAIARAVGPLGAAMIALFAILGIVFFLSLLSRETNLPILGIIGGALLIGFLIRYKTPEPGLAPPAPTAVEAGLLEDLADLPEPPGSDGDDQDPDAALKQRFGEWLAAKIDSTEWFEDPDETRPFPVFVIAASGGGAYAATATAAFLGGMHRTTDGRFDDHVFAISAVSGGALGASVYRALLSSEDLDPEQIERKAGEHVLAGHIGPVLSVLPRDLICQFTRLTEATPLRDDILARSMTEGAGGPLAAVLDRPFESFSDEITKPALVLNTTWSENGYRVAFAPFALHEVGGGDGTSLSFHDIRPSLNAPGVERRQKPRSRLSFCGGERADDPSLDSLSLMRAALVSARFPGVLPAYEIEKEPGKRWHFVDGGYADSSGVTTALEIVRSLEAYWAPEARRYLSREQRIRIHLVFIGGEPTGGARDLASDLENQPGGAARDTGAAVTTTLQIRSLNSRLATRRAQRHFGWSAERFHHLPLQTGEVGIPLSFQLSRLTAAMTAVQMRLEGDPPSQDEFAEKQRRCEESKAKARRRAAEQGGDPRADRNACFAAHVAANRLEIARLRAIIAP